MGLSIKDICREGWSNVDRGGVKDLTDVRKLVHFVIPVCFANTHWVMPKYKF